MHQETPPAKVASNAGLGLKAPRVDSCIEAVMARHPGASIRADTRYYQAVHQALAPLARRLESELAAERHAAAELALKADAAMQEAAQIIKELCQCYGHPTPDATLARLLGDA